MVRGLEFNRFSESHIEISGSNNRIEGNFIGTSKDGTSPLGNGAGVAISSSSGNTVGGTIPGAANTIAFNTGDGVDISGEGTGNRILSNSIFSNGEDSIDLNSDGPTANDPGDTDTGENDLQNFPEISSAGTFGSTTVTGTLNSTSLDNFAVQFFSNPPGEDEGKTFLGEKTVSTDSGGDASFSFTTPAGVPSGSLITATAISQDGDTSEFSEGIEAKQQFIPSKKKKKKKGKKKRR